MRLLLSSALLLLAASASAQPATRGVYGSFGVASPEQLLFPSSAAPTFVVGVRAGSGVDLHVGRRASDAERSSLLTDEVGAFEERTRNRALVLSPGLTLGVGRADLDVRASVGYQTTSRQFGFYRPDSTTVHTRSGRQEVYALVPDTFGFESGEFVHGGLSVAAVLPVRLGRRGRSRPGVGLAGAVSTRLNGNEPTPAAQWMAYVRIPTTARLGSRLHLTIEATAGVSRVGRRYGTETVYQTEPVVSPSIRLDF